MLRQPISEGIDQIAGVQRLLTYQEAADILGMKPQTLRQWVSAGKLSHVKIGSAVRFRPDQLEEFIMGSTRKRHG